MLRRCTFWPIFIITDKTPVQANPQISTCTGSVRSSVRIQLGIHTFGNLFPSLCQRQVPKLDGNTAEHPLNMFVTTLDTTGRNIEEVGLISSIPNLVCMFMVPLAGILMDFWQNNSNLKRTQVNLCFHGFKLKYSFSVFFWWCSGTNLFADP